MQCRRAFQSDSFEEATEFGVPRAIRPPSDVLKLGYQFKDFDISLRATWKFLRAATAEQVAGPGDPLPRSGQQTRDWYHPPPILHA